MINAWQWEKSKAIAFPAWKCKSRLNFHVQGQFKIKILKVQLMNTTYFTCILKKLNLSLRSFEKWQLVSGYLQKNTQSIPEPVKRSGDTGQQKHYFDSCQSIKTWMYKIRLQAPKLARKCEIKHWYACGEDGRKVGWSVYGHVIAEFSRMDRFSKLWGFELSPWSNKISAQNFKHYVTSMDRKMSPRYTQVMMVSVYSSLTAVN